MTENEPHDSKETFASIVREALARGFLDHEGPHQELKTTGHFKEAFGDVLKLLNAPSVDFYTKAILRSFGQNPPSMGTFVRIFVIHYQNFPGGRTTIEVLLSSTADDLANRYLVSLRTILGLCAFTIHRNLFPLPAASECSPPT